MTYASRLTLEVTVRIGVAGASGNAVDGPPGSADTVNADIENVIGSPRGDVIVGSAQNNVMDGGAGADQVTGLGGTDTMTYGLRTTPVSASIGEAGGNADDGGGDSIGSDIENLDRRMLGDMLAGNDDDPQVAGSGRNRVDGAGGDDRLLGGKAADQLVGGPGRTWPTTRTIRARSR